MLLRGNNSTNSIYKLFAVRGRDEWKGIGRGLSVDVTIFMICSFNQFNMINISQTG